jgi:AcrR family transcriptional regulator
MAVSSRSDRGAGKLPRGPHKLEPAQVAADQRRRLIDAIVQSVVEHGYVATTVADLIERAEVSRKTFYEHFPDSDALLLAAFDDAAAEELEEARAAAKRTGGSTRQFEAVMNRLCRTAAQSPGKIALCTIEIAAVQPEGLRHREHLLGSYGELIAECLGVDPKQLPPLPLSLIRALAGSVHRTIDARLRARRREDLKALAPQLARWVRNYHPIPEDLLVLGESSLETHADRCLGGGRAPGTLTLAPNGYQLPAMKRLQGFVYHSNRERILDSVARLTATQGYAELSARSIAEHADISERAFLAHFKSKDAAFAVAVELGHMKAQGLVERARSTASNWREGVSQAIRALLDFLASEPYFTRLAFVNAPLAGPAMARRTHEHAGAYARLLFDGAPQRRRPPRVAPEAIVQGIFELAFHHATENAVERLLQLIPVTEYLALAPFLGNTEAAEVAGQQ